MLSQNQRGEAQGLKIFSKPLSSWYSSVHALRTLVNIMAVPVVPAVLGALTETGH